MSESKEVERKLKQDRWKEILKWLFVIVLVIFFSFPFLKPLVEAKIAERDVEKFLNQFGDSLYK
jgi:hypothetical protein